MTLPAAETAEEGKNLPPQAAVEAGLGRRHVPTGWGRALRGGERTADVQLQRREAQESHGRPQPATAAGRNVRSHGARP
jgi:hypothetical protein